MQPRLKSLRWTGKPESSCAANTRVAPLGNDPTSELEPQQKQFHKNLDGRLRSNPVNDRRVANAVTLKSAFRPVPLIERCSGEAKFFSRGSKNFGLVYFSPGFLLVSKKNTNLKLPQGKGEFG